MPKPPATSQSRTWLDQCVELRDLPRLVKELLVRCMVVRHYPAGAQVILEGEEGTELMLVTGGCAHAMLEDEDGSTKILSRFHPGEIFGEMALVTKEPRSATVVAESDLTVLALSGDDFDVLATEFPGVAIVLTNLVAKRLGRRRVDGMRGKMVGHYRIRRCVGRGGMAVVYEAEDTEHERTVALKMMSHQLVYTPGAMRRFEREANILLELEHENVAGVHEHFTAFRTAFIAMEYCNGASLARLLRELGPCTEEVARSVLGQLAAALQYLHASNVIHRDLKPGNVMFDREGVLKLTDFGLAKPGDSPASGVIDPSHEIHPETSILAGTPLYMAPELFTGGDQRELSDLYSLGCIAYELLTGRPPIVQSDFGELVAEKLDYELPPRRHFPVRVSRKLYKILSRLLDYDPLQRRVSLAELTTWAAPLPEEFFELDPETSF